MRRFKYVRVSSNKTQNVARQLDDNCELFIDKCSGKIPFLERPEASRMFEKLTSQDVLEISSVDRLGRNKLDMLLVLEELKQKKIKVHIQNLGINSFLENGKYNSVFDIVTTLLSSLAEHEYLGIKERTEQGIAIAKAKGNVYVGRKKGSVLSRDVFMERNKKSIQIIKKHPHLSLRDLSKLTQISHVKVKKIKEML